MVKIVSAVQEYGYSVVLGVFDCEDSLYEAISSIKDNHKCIKSDQYEFSIVEEGQITQSIKIEEVLMNDLSSFQN